MQGFRHGWHLKAILTWVPAPFIAGLGPGPETITGVSR